jgi:PadR family transcriptional regulator AphA
MTGYELKKIFDDSINFFWPAQTSQIYRELKTLEKKEYLTSAIQPSEKGPHKRIYTITEQGILSLKDWLANPPEVIDEGNRNTFALRIFFSSHVGIDELFFQVQKKLKTYKKEYEQLKLIQEQKLAEYVQMIGQEDEVYYWKIVLSKGFRDVGSNIQWAEETLAYLQKLKKEKGVRKHE